MGIGNSIHRVDAKEKVTGRARYTDDLTPQNALEAKLVRSTIANGLVTGFSLEQARAVPGVVKILTCFDAPAHSFPTAGHPWSTDPKHQDVADRRLLNTRVRIYGDEIAVVIAENALAAEQAARLVQVQYETYPPLVSPAQAMSEGASELHEGRKHNLLAHSGWTIGEGDFAQAIEGEQVRVFEQQYATQIVQHCHIEPPVSFAYMEQDRITVVSSTQIPHIVRRVIGQALGIGWGKIRVIKPYIGGGFGNKQEVLYEPLNAWLTTRVGGRPVRLELTREETFTCTRVRHAIDFSVKTAVRPDGRLVARQVSAVSNQGGYASHGHAIVANAINEFRHLYQDEKFLSAEADTVYTNLASAGAMRGYGIPQAIFALESSMDEIAAALGLDPIELRAKNWMQEGYVDPMTGIRCYSSGLAECVEKGRKRIGWDEKRKAYQHQSGPVRRGIGMAIFSYKTGVYPISLETASCRMILNQDGSAQLQMGATEIGQGADTVFTQMAAETVGLREQDVHIVTVQDTDVTPFDTGAYASRQTYVSGSALRQTAELFRARILDYAAKMLGLPAETLDLRGGEVRDKSTGQPLLALAALAEEAFYSLTDSVHITAESTYHCNHNTFAFGACFAEVEVDLPLGRVKLLNILNVHDSGVLINPKLAEAQVHGGMSMGLGYALGEQLLYDAQARPLNGNLLDYKLPTAIDTPELQVDFVETVDPSAPYGNKALGEPPAIPVAPAVRNAIYQATGIPLESLPMNPQKLVERLKQAGLLGEEA